VRFLIDENLSPRLCEYFAVSGDSAEHIYDTLAAGSTDEEILDRAAEHQFVIVTADTDFGTLLAMDRTSKPSVILVRELLSLTVAEQGALLSANLDQIRDALAEGAIVVFSPRAIRVRPLPLA
jgi:predicted nuclease of predicted toxin-antitoxin system